MNPYASNLGGQNPLDVIRTTAGRLEGPVHRLDAADLTRPPAPGKWSIRDIVCHLADCEIVFAFRLRQTLAEDRHVIQPFDQDLWSPAYAHYDARTALVAFAAVREWNLALMVNLPPAAFTRELNHPERGDMTFQTVVETMAGHDLNHLKQIEAILA
jgi:DinB superfamily